MWGKKSAVTELAEKKALLWNKVNLALADIQGPWEDKSSSYNSGYLGKWISRQFHYGDIRISWDGDDYGEDYEAVVYIGGYKLGSLELAKAKGLRELIEESLAKKELEKINKVLYGMTSSDKKA